MNDDVEDNWWRSFYNDTMADMFLVRSDAKELEATCRFLTEHLRLSRGSSVLDQCCGIGSLSLPLARAGIEVLGIDQCQSYVDRAVQSAAEGRLPAQYGCADAFSFVAARPYDAAFNWGSSFGCAGDDEQNMKMLDRAFDALKSGGRFILDYQNIPAVMRGFRQCIVRRHKTDGGEIVLLRECRIDLQAGQLEQNWTYIYPDGRKITRQSSLRLYLPHHIAEMMSCCGFTDIHFFGDVSGQDLSMDSPRCIALGTRP